MLKLNNNDYDNNIIKIKNNKNIKKKYKKKQMERRNRSSESCCAGHFMRWDALMGRERHVHPKGEVEGVDAVMHGPVQGCGCRPRCCEAFSGPYEGGYPSSAIMTSCLSSSWPSVG